MATSFRSSLYTCGLRESLHFASGEYLREGNYNRFPRQLYSTYCNSLQIYSEEGTNFCQNMSVKLLFFNNAIFQLMSLGHCWWTRKTGFLHRILKPFFMQILRKKKLFCPPAMQPCHMMGNNQFTLKLSSTQCVV